MVLTPKLHGLYKLDVPAKSDILAINKNVIAPIQFMKEENSMQTFSAIYYRGCEESSYQVEIFFNPDFGVARFDASSKDEIDNYLYDVDYHIKDINQLCDELGHIADAANNIDNIFIKMFSSIEYPFTRNDFEKYVINIGYKILKGDKITL